MDALSALLLLAALFFWWRDSLAAREAASLAARETCARQGLQFLDGSVETRGTRPALCNGRPCLRRQFRFAYSADGAGRRQGFIITLGKEVVSIGL